MAAATGKCSAKTRKGTLCAKSAGYGTDHLGFGNCKFHGGATPNGRKSAARQEAETLAAQLAGELDLEPHEALLNALRRAAAIVAVYAQKVAALREEELAVEHYKERAGDSEYVERGSAAQLHVWVRAYEEAVERQARLAKTALDAGVEERRIRVAEQFGEQLAGLIGGILDELELTAVQRGRAPDVVRRHLLAIEGGR